MGNKPCDFCNELRHRGDIRFSSIYSNTPEGRVISRSSSFSILPTLGQLFDYSLLIIPNEHVETLADLEADKIKELEIVFSKIKDDLSQLGNVIAFEHGSKSSNGGGCGIYHAHMHVIPLPVDISMFSFFKHPYNVYPSLSESFAKLRGRNEYLLAVNGNGQVGGVDISNFGNEYPSQYFRKQLHDYFNLSSSWDWREYTQREEKVLKVLKKPIITQELYSI